MTVLGAPSGDDFVAAVSPDRELYGVDGVARLDLLEEALRVVGERSRLVEIHVDRLEEAGAGLHSCHVTHLQRESSHADAVGAKDDVRGLAVAELRRYRHRRIDTAAPR